MAQLKKRGDNTWQVVVFLGRDPLTGKPKCTYRTIKAKNEREAKNEAKIFEAEILKGNYIAVNKDMLFGDFLREWINNDVKLQDSTKDNYSIILEAHIIPALGFIPLQKLEPYHFDSYYKDKIRNGRRDGKGGLSLRSVNYHKVIINKALNYAVHPLKLINSNPAFYVEVPAYTPPEMSTITVRDLDHFLNVAKDNLDLVTYVLIYIIAYTGLRPSGARALRWSDFDAEKCTLSIRQKIYKTRHGEFISDKLKTPKSKRTIKITEECVKLILEVRETYKSNCILFGRMYNIEDDLIFCNPDGSLISKEAFRHKFEKVVSKSKIKVNPKGLRHTHATHLLEAGVDIKVVSHRFGHSKTSTTWDIYQHVSESLQEDTLEKLEQKREVERRRRKNSSI